MPKRVVDGDALWRSPKLLLVPVEYRAEYANLVPLADVNGSFECDPARVWADVFSFNRPNISAADVAAVLDVFQAAGMLVRWNQEGKTWGYFVGIHTPGRLPSGKHVARYRHLPPLPPEPSINCTPADIPGDSGKRPESPPLGLGTGLGKGLGSRHSGKFPEDETSQRHPEPYEDFDGSEWALKTFKAYPTWNPDATVAPARLSDAYMATIEAVAPARGGLLKAAEWFLQITQEFASQSVGRDPQFIMGLEKFLRSGYVEVKMPSRTSAGKYAPRESDEELEARLLRENRERRQRTVEAEKVAPPEAVSA